MGRAGRSRCVGAGQKVLIHGGAGGVGHIAIQIARAFGAQVFATGSVKSLPLIERLGATPIDYGRESVEDYVRQYTDGRGFDIVFDTVGGATLDASFNAVGRFGHVVSALGWGTHALAPLSFRAATYSGVFTLLPMLTSEGRAHHGEILRKQRGWPRPANSPAGRPHAFHAERHRRRLCRRQKSVGRRQNCDRCRLGEYRDRGGCAKPPRLIGSIRRAAAGSG